MKSKLEIYALAVCFASMICLVISGGIASYAIIRILNPDLTINSYQFDRFQTNDAYWRTSNCCGADQKSLPRPSEAELTTKRQEALGIALNDEKRGGLQTLISALMFLLIGALTLIIHWILAKKARS